MLQYLHLFKKCGCFASFSQREHFQMRSVYRNSCVYVPITVAICLNINRSAKLNKKKEKHYRLALVSGAGLQ